MNKKYPLIIGAFLLTVTTTWAATTTFTDEASFADWYKPAVEQMYEMGVVKGYADGSFKPNQDVTRGELALILQRYQNNVVNSNIEAYFTSKVAEGSVGLTEAMIDKKIEDYFKEHEDDYFKRKIGSIITNVERFDDQDINHKTLIILAESGFDRLDAKPDLSGFTQQENVKLPQDWVAYEGMPEHDFDMYPPIYLNYKGQRIDGDVIYEADEWYGPF